MPAPCLHHVLVGTRDLEACRRFYREVLELEEIPRPNFPFDGVWFGFGDGQSLHVAVIDRITMRGDKAVDPGDVHFALAMKSYTKTVAGLREKGYAAELPDNDPHKMVVRPNSITGRPQIYIMDPDHNIIEFSCESTE